MTRSLALHQITAMEAGPVELVAIAAAMGCRQVCIFTHNPVAVLPDRSGSRVFPLVTRANQQLMREALRAHDILPDHGK